MTRTQSAPELDRGLTEAVHRLYVRPVDPERARQDVAMIAEAARQADLNRGPAVSAGAASTLRRRRMPLWRPALAAAVAVVAVPGGMAAAGVDVPEAFEAPYRAVGVALPNQDEDPAVPRRSDRARERLTETPAATTPAVTGPPSSTRSSATTPSPSSARRGEERSQRAKRRRAATARRAQRATPAIPATPARPAEPGERGSRATPATPARPAEPASPARESGSQDEPTITSERARGMGAEQRRQRFPRGSRGSVNESDALRIPVE